MQELQKRLLRSFSLLPPRHQRELITFAELLSQKKLKKQTIEKDAVVFFGMWADRPEMQDSSRWVRNLRKKQWNLSQ